MDSTMLARMGLSSAGGTSEFACANVSRTKPNSPACARYRPVRSDTPEPAPSILDSAVTSAALNNVGTANSSNTIGQRSRTSRQSSNIPMLMKKRPSNTS